MAAIKKIKSKKNGSILAFSLLIVFFLLVISVGMATVAVTEFKSSSSTAKSTQAFQYADTGAENVLITYKTSTNKSANLSSAQGLNTSCEGGPGSDAYIGSLAVPTQRYKVIFLDKDRNRLQCNDEVGDVRFIKSTGSHLNNTRAIEVMIPCTSPYGPETDVVGLWHFQEGVGVFDPIVDSSIELNNGTASAGATSNTAMGICNSKEFSGNANGLITISDDASLRLGDHQTVELWARWNGTGTEWQRLVGKGNANNRNYGIWLHPTRGWLYQIYNNGGTLRCDAYINPAFVAPVANEWTHIAGTYDGANIKLYRNGNEIYSTACTVSPANNGQPLLIGDSQYGAGHEPFRGLIDEVRIFDTNRSESQIQADFELGCNMIEPKPAACP